MVHRAEAEAPSFPELLRFKRVQAGLTQRTLADLSTISPRTIRALESGRVNARMQTVRLLADALRLGGLPRELFVTAALGSQQRGPAGGDPALAVPRSVNALIGRDTEVRAMAGGLESDHRRMVSVSGLPGVGKSRVAAELAARLSARRGWPVLWIGSGAVAVDGPGTAFGPVTASLRRLVESGAQEAAQEVSTVCRLIGRREVLLVLDGVADARCGAGVEELLTHCPGVRVVSTSRAPWHVAGVQGTVVPPLAVPGADWEATRSLEALAQVPSVRLLVDRLAEVRPGFVLGRDDAEAVVRLCRRLDGLPVALEAVAARFRVLSLARLADAPAPDLLDLPVPAWSAGVPGTVGSMIRSGFEDLDAARRAVLEELVRFERAPTVTEAAAALGLPLTRVVDELGALMACGLVRASHEEAETRLHLPNLLRAALTSG
ncbi:helix-turn-helix domain-containing protein [Streptomyces sp. NBC_00503]|uniref:helix-turn-helix domain-containing protein n=1 Tax=Streptomyces sp. NBC_00503 TaxID=2903659 RepID=UPI002E81F68E|nr:helix-turn-helix domain-containing protein [Streptomyces sp. NBC_00503]WUD79569.1 helix-turn-helix domain-containing protein [Streptomyces sp. NBC_00503]